MDHQKLRVTHHMDARMNQRGIPGALVDLVLQHGEWQGDACRLGRKDLRNLANDVEKLRATVRKALDKGGLTVVEEQGCLITAYSHMEAKHRASRR